VGLKDNVQCLFAKATYGQNYRFTVGNAAIEWSALGYTR